MTSPQQRRVDAYLNTVGRLEPEITPIDADAAFASIAISLKRIADRLDVIGALAAEIVPGRVVEKINPNNVW